jgi:hypothetical protein
MARREKAIGFTVRTVPPLRAHIYCDAIVYCRLGFPNRALLQILRVRGKVSVMIRVAFVLPLVR